MTYLLEVAGSRCYNVTELLILGNMFYREMKVREDTGYEEIVQAYKETGRELEGL